MMCRVGGTPWNRGTLKPDATALPELERQSAREDAEQRWIGGVEVRCCWCCSRCSCSGWAKAMVQHHFFTGGAMNYGNHPDGAVGEVWLAGIEDSRQGVGEYRGVYRVGFHSRVAAIGAT